MRLAEILGRRGGATTTGFVAVPVCTPGRSGGSALVDALLRHPRLLGCERWPHEQEIASNLMRLRHRAQLRREAKNANGSEDSIYPNGGSPFSSREKAEIGLFEKDVLRPLDLAYRAATENFYADLRAEYGKPAADHFVEKAVPEIVADYGEVFPQVRVLVLLRDPRDACISAARFFARDADSPFLRGDSNEPVLNVARGRYGRDFEAFARVLEELAAQRRPHLVLKYEELVATPEPVLRRVVEFLGLGDDPAGLAAMCATFVEGQLKQKHMTAPTLAATVGRWQHELAPPVRDELAALLAPVARRLGYDA